MRTLARAGISIIEVPLNSPQPIDSIRAAAKALEGRASVGAGTVLKEDDVDAVAAASGTFIVSPDCNEAVIARTRARGFDPIRASSRRRGVPGHQSRRPRLEVFPAEVLGAAGIKAMKAVLPPKIPLYAVGGANPDNFAEFLAAGCTGFGIGSYLYKPGTTVAEIAARAHALSPLTIEQGRDEHPRCWVRT